MKKSAVGAALCSLACTVMLNACGSSSGNQPDITFPASTGSATSAPAVTTEPATTPATASAQSPPGKDYVDPQGKYTMTIGKKWKTAKGSSIAESWVIGTPDHGIKPNLNITTEDLPAVAQGISPDIYMKLSIKNLKKAGFNVIKSGVIRGINTPNLGAIEYTGKTAKGTTLHLLAILDLNDSEAAIATMAASPQSFVKYRVAAQPYMRTLKVSGKSA